MRQTGVSQVDLCFENQIYCKNVKKERGLQTVGNFRFDIDTQRKVVARFVANKSLNIRLIILKIL
jgi:hypothetical protein